MENGKNKQQRPKGNIRIHFETRDVKFPLPSRIVYALLTKEIDDRKIRSTVTRALWQLAYEKPLPLQLPEEGLDDYIRRIALESRNGSPLSLDEPLFVDGMTVREWFDKSEKERQALWDQWHEEAGEDIEAEYGRGIDVKPKTLVRQKRSKTNPRSVNEARSRYRTQRTRKKSP